MKIYSVFDPEFKPYGQIVKGLDGAVQEILAGLAETPLPDGVGYVPTEPILQNLPAAEVISNHCFGGMPVQLGWCNGHNTKLNCLVIVTFGFLSRYFLNTYPCSSRFLSPSSVGNKLLISVIDSLWRSLFICSTSKAISSSV